MRPKKVNLLKSLIETPAPSGFELKLAQLIRRQLVNYLPRTKVTIDSQNNVIAIIPGTIDETIMIDAHLDEIGFIVSNIDKEGFISLQYIGGGDHSILSARQLQILTNKGTISAVVDRKHSHLVDNEAEETIEHISDAQIDIGIRKIKQVMKHVKIGDPVVYCPNFTQLIDDYYSGYGFDDKSGCFVLMEAIKEIVRTKKQPLPTLIFTFSSQEETGKSKIRPLIRKYKPDLFIELDVTFATDYGVDLEKEVGRCELGKGIVLYRGVDIDNSALKLIQSIARKHKIKIQYQASVGNMGYTATEVTDYVSKALIIGIPLRNMHTSVEIINTKDLNYGINLIKNFCISREIRRIL